MQLMQKVIVTHVSPDLDAITAVWLLKRFGGKEFEEAVVEFVSANSTYKGEPVDSDPEVIHVDVGRGKFDHHQRPERTCAATLVYEWLAEKRPDLKKDEALKKLIEVVEGVDYDVADLAYPEPESDRYAFLFNERSIIGGWYRQYPGQNEKYVDWGLVILDGVYQSLKSRLAAKKLLAGGKAVEFETRWGKGVAVETSEREFMPVAFMKGFRVVVTKDPGQGFVRIKAWGGKEKERIDLTVVYDILQKQDPKASWFFHISRKMILNGSRVAPDAKPSKLTIKELIKLLGEV